MVEAITPVHVQLPNVVHEKQIKSHYGHTPVNLQFFHEKPYSQFWMHTETSTATRTKINWQKQKLIVLTSWWWLLIFGCLYLLVFLTSSGTFPVHNFFLKRVCLYQYLQCWVWGYIINPNLIHNQIHGWGMGPVSSESLDSEQGGVIGE